MSAVYRKLFNYKMVNKIYFKDQLSVLPVSWRRMMNLDGSSVSSLLRMFENKYTFMTMVVLHKEKHWPG